MLVKDLESNSWSFKASEVKKYLWKNSQVQVNYAKAWKKLGKVLEKVNRNYESSYAKVSELCAQNFWVNPKSVAKWVEKRPPKHLSVYVLTISVVLMYGFKNADQSQA